jgi:DNA processing protein
MTTAHLYSNFCPFFSVSDLDEYQMFFGNHSAITFEKLTSLKKYKAAQWLQSHEVGWRDYLHNQDEWFAKAGQGNFRAILWGEINYPENLKTIAYPPSILFVVGDDSILHKPSVAIVGSRSPTQLGRLWIENVMPNLIREGLIISSGGARGIDSEAHTEAVKARGKTIVFLPGGVDRPYPRSNQFLFDEIVQSGGLLISEFPPGTQVRAENFFRRNRLIAGASDVVAIVEAGHKSGTMLTAKCAYDENKTVLVVPGPPMIASYAGSLQLLFEGAQLLRDASDIIRAVKEKNALIKSKESPTVGA